MSPFPYLGVASPPFPRLGDTYLCTCNCDVPGVPNITSVPHSLCTSTSAVPNRYICTVQVPRDRAPGESLWGQTTGGDGPAAKDHAGRQPVYSPTRLTQGGHRPLPRGTQVQVYTQGEYQIHSDSVYTQGEYQTHSGSVCTQYISFYVPLCDVLSEMV